SISVISGIQAWVGLSTATASTISTSALTNSNILFFIFNTKNIFYVFFKYIRYLKRQKHRRRIVAALYGNYSLAAHAYPAGQLFFVRFASVRTFCTVLCTYSC